MSRRRRAAVRPALVALVVALAATLVIPAASWANPALNVQTFRPAPFDGDLLTLMSSDPGAHLGWSAALLTHFGRDALIFRDESAAARRDHGVVRDQLTMDLSGSLGLFEWVTLGVSVPVFLVNEGDLSGFSTAGPVSGAVLGDVRVTPKVRVLRRPAGDGFGLAVALGLGLPTGDDTAFVSDGLTFTPTLLGDLRLGHVLVVMNVGYTVRDEVTLSAAQTVGNELTFGAGAAVDVVAERLAILAEVTAGSSDFGADAVSRAEGTLAARLRFADLGLTFTAGGGAGLLSGYGNVAYRLFAGVGVTPGAEPAEPEPPPPPPPPVDTDGDGVPDDHDACFDQPEDVDGFRDGDGCPDPDNDEDGVLDTVDACPDEAEDIDGDADEDGCPEADTDADGDGLVGSADGCPDAAEDIDGFEDTDGCPEPDNDADGIPDTEDFCPLDAKNTCAVVCELKVDVKIRFSSGGAVIDPASLPTLAPLMEALKTNVWIQKLEVQGHTDSAGPAAFNLNLSQQRADAVLAYLVTQGVDAARLVAKGYGETVPVASNSTRAGRVTNRRVQFVIAEPTRDGCN